MRSDVSALVAIVLLAWSAKGEDKPPSDPEIAKLKKTYAETVDRYNALKEGQSIPRNLSANKFGDEVSVVRDHSWEAAELLADGEEVFVVRVDRESFEFRFLKNCRLSAELAERRKAFQQDLAQKKRRPRTYLAEYMPMKLTVPEAVERAKKYLAHFNVKVPPEYSLHWADFGDQCFDLWCIEWRPTFRGLPYEAEDEGGESPPNVSVTFHETLGLLCLGQTGQLPVPTEYDVKITRDEAITKAFKVAPLVQETSFYKSCRVAGFVPCSFRDASLQVVVPNWLLDPDRAIWITDEPPKETRVCWVVHVLTRPSTQELSDRNLILPVITICLDAKTGEVVMATFK